MISGMVLRIVLLPLHLSYNMNHLRVFVPVFIHLSQVLAVTGWLHSDKLIINIRTSLLGTLNFTTPLLTPTVM